MVEQSKLRLTIDEFEDFLAEHRESLYELIEGEIIEKMVTEEHGYLTVNIAALLYQHVKPQNIGRVLTHVHYQLAENEFNCRSIDVSFRRTTEARVKKGAVKGMPDLAVEIKSPDDSNKQMRAAADFYLAHGAKMVWLVFPDKELVEVHLPSGDYETYKVGDTISGGGILPDFSMTVAEIFE